jgi:hypothetical protein
VIPRTIRGLIDAVSEEAKVVGSGEGNSGGGWSNETRGNRFQLSGGLTLRTALVTLAAALGLMGVPASTLAAPRVAEEFVSNVSATSATLQACVNPESFEPTSYEFEYGTSLSYGASVQAAAGGAGTCSSGVGVQAHVQGLTAHTPYDYRVLASVGSEAIAGPGREFTTQSAGGESELPDGRAWELVSPPRKDGALIPPTGETGRLVQAAEGGGAITYTSIGPAYGEHEEPAGNANETQVLSVRDGSGGWSSRDIATPHAVSTGASGAGQEYRSFSPELAVGLVEPLGSGFTGNKPEGAALLSPGASEKTLYLRADEPLLPGSAEAVPYDEAEAEGGYKALVTSKPGYANVQVQAGAKFGGKIEFLDATPDLRHVVLVSHVPLTAEAEEVSPYKGLYEWTAGQLRLVSVLPKGAPYNGMQAEEAFLGFHEEDARGAISSDGSRVVFSDEISGGTHLFMRDVADGQTAQLDLVDGGDGDGDGEAKFQFANSDGSKVFFTDEEALLPGSKAETNMADLYECEMVEDEFQGLSCKLKDLTEDPAEGAGVQGVVLAGSDSGSYVYFVANAVLAENKNGEGKEAEPGDCKSNNSGEETTCNLYVRHYNEESGEWEPAVFVATLTDEDWPDWSGGNGGRDLEDVTSRVSPDGEYIAFMSERSLTGYDNRDVNSGELDEEVYLYRAPTAGASVGRLVCVSCNPTGERPAGVLDSREARGGEGLLADKQNVWGRYNRWLAGSVPGWTAIAKRKALYQSRYLLDSGRMFFDSPDMLVPQATNGLENVYEYEPEGVGDCTSSGTFSKEAGGCVSLISSGKSREESVFMDASGLGPGGEEGEDVFFLTSESLVSKDEDSAFDVYDAHVCSTTVPCTTEVVASPVCNTTESCRAAPTLQPSIFGAPASATFTGAGNILQLPSATTKCVKGKKMRHGKCIKVKSRKTKIKGRKKPKVSSDQRGG